VLRSGWEPDSTVISLRAGPWFNHEHHDEGSFQIAAFGQKLVDEGGYASYYTDPHYADYFTQAAGHNTLLIDGDPFSQGAFNGRYWPAFQHPTLSAWLLASSFDYVAADLTAAYDGRLRSYQREFVFLKPDILVIHDSVRSAQPHVFSWLLHAPSGSNLTIHGAQASIESPNGASATLTAAGPNASWTAETTPLKVLLFKDLDHQHIEPSRELLLQSPSVPATHFLVGIKLNKGRAEGRQQLETWNQPAGEGLRTNHGELDSIVFRTAAGPLRIANMTTDGSLLVCRGATAQLGWMAVGAGYVEDGGHVVFQASAPTDVAEESLPSGLTFDLRTSALDIVKIFHATAPAGVEVDGQKVSSTYKDAMVLLPALSAGKHHVSIH
jgi:hypothetical protein